MFIGLLPTSQTLARATLADPIKLYGDEIYFDVFREGDKVGSHSVKFISDNESTIVRIAFSIEIDFLFQF